MRPRTWHRPLRRVHGRSAAVSSNPPSSGPRPVAADRTRLAGHRARAGGDSDLDGAAVVVDPSAALLAAAARVDERLELGAVRVGEALAEVLRKAPAIARREESRVDLADERRAVRADDLAANVVPVRARARDVRRGQRAVVEADCHDAVVDIAQSFQLRVDARLARSG